MSTFMAEAAKCANIRRAIFGSQVRRCWRPTSGGNPNMALSLYMKRLMDQALFLMLINTVMDNFHRIFLPERFHPVKKHDIRIQLIGLEKRIQIRREFHDNLGQLNSFHVNHPSNRICRSENDVARACCSPKNL